MKFKDRIKSYKFWVALSASLVILLQALGEAFNFTIPEEIINGITTGFCGVLVVLGIIEQPKIESEIEKLVEDKSSENTTVENNVESESKRANTKNSKLTGEK